MEYNKLRLKQEEIDFIKTRYQDVDYDNLMYLVEGMSTIRNIDMLISSLDYDIEHKDFTALGENADKQALVLLCKDIKDKAVYYRDHNVPFVEGISPPSAGCRSTSSTARSRAIPRSTV